MKDLRSCNCLHFSSTHWAVKNILWIKVFLGFHLNTHYLYFRKKKFKFSLTSPSPPPTPPHPHKHKNFMMKKQILRNGTKGFWKKELRSDFMIGFFYFTPFLVCYLLPSSHTLSWGGESSGYWMSQNGGCKTIQGHKGPADGFCVLGKAVLPS